MTVVEMHCLTNGPDDCGPLALCGSQLIRQAQS